MKKIYLRIMMPMALFILGTGTINGQTWNKLSTGLRPQSPLPNVTMALFSDGNNIYAGGTFDTAGGVHVRSIAKWDGAAWSDMGGGFNDFVWCMAMYRGELYAGGGAYIDTDPALDYLAKWHDGWVPVDSNMGGLGGANIAAMVVIDSILYLGGTFNIAGGVPAQNVAAYNGTSFSSLGDATGSNALIMAMTTFNGKLIIGGQFDHVGSVAANNIAMWDGTHWSAMDVGIQGVVYSLAANGDNLYAGGAFTKAGGVAHKNIAKWNGTLWSDVNGPGANSNVEALTIANSKLYVGGGFDSIGGQAFKNIAVLDGATWSGLGTGTGPNATNSVTAILVHNNDVYMGGTFYESTSGPGNNIARWGLPTSTGVDEVAENNGVTISPNPGNGLINITLKNPTEKAVVEVYNLLGERIHHGNFVGDKATIDIGNEPTGVYLYRISKTDGTLIATGKYVRQ